MSPFVNLVVLANEFWEVAQCHVAGSTSSAQIDPVDSHSRQTKMSNCVRRCAIWKPNSQLRLRAGAAKRRNSPGVKSAGLAVESVLELAFVLRAIEAAFRFCDEPRCI